MASLTWFWRLVCSPDCSEACQVDCPGCRAMAPEWEQQGRRTMDVTHREGRFRWSRFKYLWSCWSRSAMARAVSRLGPTRWVARVESVLPRRWVAKVESKISAAAGCGCEPAATVASAGASTAAPVAGPAPVQTAAGCGCGPSTVGLTAGDAAIRDEVQRHYSGHALEVMSGSQGGCCSPGLPADVSCTVLYPEEELQALPAEALIASLGCGNPLARADLKAGEVVLDLGSGGGMDVCVAAARVGPTGRVVGLDMSEEMLDLARTNAEKVGASNVEFSRGDLEAIPLRDDSVDVIISNCVVNLAPDKSNALHEAHRVLRPGGRLAISDIVTRTPVPAALKNDLTAWAACLGGALTEQQYRDHLTAAGFLDIEIERDREYTAADAEAAGLSSLLTRLGIKEALSAGFASTSVRARKAGPSDHDPSSVDAVLASNRRGGDEG
ncbi:MAG TPA: arsenite methyltransferase [Mycobacteriales bacterium]